MVTTRQAIADVVVVLGAAVWQDGEASPALLRRSLHAISLLKDGRARYLLATGGLGKFPPTEAAVIRRIALENGIPDERILREESSTSTLENVLNCIGLMTQLGLSTAIVVSDPYQVQRAMLVFRHFGIAVSGSPALGGKEANPKWKWLYFHIREVFALPWYKVVLMWSGRQLLKKVQSLPSQEEVTGANSNKNVR